MLDVLLLQLGTSTSKAVARMWIKSDVALDTTDGLIERLGSRIPGLIERRRTARQFEDMADRVANQLQPFVESEFGGIEENELTAAVLGVVGVVDSVQNIDTPQLFSLDLDPVGLEALLRNQPSMRVRNDLALPAQLVFDRLLRENCNYVVELTMNLPQFTSSALVEVLRRQSEISDRVQAVLDRIPQPAPLAADADQEFEVTYRRHIARELDRLELFGLTLTENSSRYELSIAYISLSASATATEVDSAADKLDRPKSQDSDDAAGQSGLEDGSEDEAYLRVDEALSRGSRHLIRGEAGSGKTTLLQWLAVSAARKTLPDALTEWSDSLPFFIQLRRYANADLPAPEDFLHHAAGPIAGVMPNGWVHRQLMAGNAILLVDAVDELPEHQRKAARGWLLQLINEFPECRFVITTRPPAIPDTWLDAGAFNLLELLPMSLPDTLSFIQHWYDAARHAVAHVDGQPEVLTEYQLELMRVIRDTTSIRALATTPLLCAMLCALNRDRRTQLPRDRMELYRIALESLLDRRDAEREISQHEQISLGLREKETLLQDLAHWLVLNEQTDVSKPEAIERIRTRLGYMSSIRGSAEDVFAHLLTRSGLIREPVDGRIDFIHRTFQEYLGAARVMIEGNIPMLISKAHGDQWREVIILSAGHGNRHQCDMLLSGLLQRGNEDVFVRHRLHLLAVACLETAIELSPQTKLAVEDALAQALPPTNMTEARAVASAGPLAAPLLSRFDNELATTTAACARALCLIGGDEALTALTRFRGDRRVTVTRELIRGWDYFDRALYATEVLASSQLDHGSLVVSDPEALETVHVLRGLRRLVFTPPSPSATCLSYATFNASTSWT